MGTYLNGYQQLIDVRYGINEHSDNLVKGIDTSGKYQNDYLLSRINVAQRLLYAILLQYLPDQFLTNTSATVTSSVITLPWDFAEVRELKDENGYKVYPSTVGVLPATGGQGNDNLYYRKGNTLVLNKSGVSETYTLWYRTKPRDLTQGKCLAENTLTSNAKLIADYYNNMILETITGDWIDTISDYTAARVVTLSTETLDANDYYGIVSEIPEMFHPLISTRALMLVKSEHPEALGGLTKSLIADWHEQLNDALRAFAGIAHDISQEEIWTDYGTGPGGAGVNIPGQGYTIY